MFYAWKTIWNAWILNNGNLSKGQTYKNRHLLNYIFMFTTNDVTMCIGTYMYRKKIVKSPWILLRMYIYKFYLIMVATTTFIIWRRFYKPLLLMNRNKKVHTEFDDTKSITILVCNLEFDIRYSINYKFKLWLDFF